MYLKALEIHFTPLQATKTPVFSIGSQYNEAIGILWITPLLHHLKRLWHSPILYLKPTIWMNSWTRLYPIPKKPRFDLWAWGTYYFKIGASNMREGIIIPDMQSGPPISVSTAMTAMAVFIAVPQWIFGWTSNGYPPALRWTAAAGFWSAFRSRHCGDRGCASAGDQTAAPSKAGCKAVNFAEAIPVSWSQGVTSSFVSRTGIRSWTLMILLLKNNLEKRCRKW